VIVSIIIVSYNARADLERCLESLRRAPPASAYEVVVVDNASADGSADAARRCGARVVENRTNAGFAKATNTGIRASSGLNLLLLNSDTIVPANAVDQMINEIDRDAGVAIVGPRLVDGNGRPELSFGPMIGPLNEARQKWRARRDLDRMTRTRRYTDWVSGACLLVRRGDAEAVGLFDERFFMYLEDVDFCAAVRARGRRILFAPSIEVVHLRGRSRQAAPGATEAAYRQSQIAFYQKHHPGWTPLLKGYLRLRKRL
jgi:GT2 family glycosyltransferase